MFDAWNMNSCFSICWQNRENWLWSRLRWRHLLKICVGDLKCTQHTHSEWPDLTNYWYLCLNTPLFQNRAELQDSSQDLISRPTCSHREVTDNVNSRSSSKPRLLDFALQQVNMQTGKYAQFKSKWNCCVANIHSPCIWLTFISCLIKV